MNANVLPWEARRAFPMRRTALWAALALLAAGLAAGGARAAEVTGAADRGLGFVLGILLPLLALGAVLHLAGGENLRELGASSARYGADRRAGVLRAQAAVTLGLALLSCLVAVSALLAARGVGDPQLLADLLATIPIALTSALAYGMWLAAGACFGSRGAGVLVALLVDWLAGATALPVALATPRGHTRYLLGLEAAFEFPAWVSFAALVGLAFLGAGVVAVRVPR